MIDLVYLSYKADVPAKDYWDLALLKDLFAGDIWWPVGWERFIERDSLAEVADGAVVVFPARRQVDMVERLNTDLKRLKWVVLMLVGDEDNEFDSGKIKHPNLKLWVMTPHPDMHGDDVRRVGTGYAPGARQYLGEKMIKKDLDYAFLGQVTHSRRIEMAAAIAAMNHPEHKKLEGAFHPTKGFTQGLPLEGYYATIARAKTMPAPSGAISPDSFRIFEALESGAVPIADTRSPRGHFPDDYWTWFFGEEPPFPVLTSYEQLNGYITDAVSHYPAINNKVFAWWQKMKREMVYQLITDVGGVRTPAGHEAVGLRDKITVLIPTSPIPDHPSTTIIEETVSNIRQQLPTCEIIIMVDGIHKEQKHYRKNYETYIQKLLWLSNFEWRNVLPILFNENKHQATMTRQTLAGYVRTPTVLFVEHDTPITGDNTFDWYKLVDAVMDGTANIIRFAHESHILEPHKHLMLGEESHNGLPLTKTKQYSQRPHLASTAYYSHMLEVYFNPESRTMIEDVMHQIIEVDCREHGDQAWFNYRLWMYTPPGNIQRSYNLDGRKDDPKFDMIIKEVEKK